MESEELIALMKEVEERGIDWKTVETSIKVPHALLKLYVNSGPVPVTITSKLKKFLETQPKG